MPSSVADVRRDCCRQKGCVHVLDYNDPCAACPAGHWGRWSGSCTTIEPALPVAAAAVVEKASPGAGTTLRGMIARLGLKPASGCQCAARAALMDRAGPDWCAEHIEEIVGWLRDEAKRAGLPFFAPGARLLIRRAIRQARERPG